MEMVPVLLRQLTIMALYMAVGYFLFRKKLVSVQGCKELGNLLINVILPCTIISSFCAERTPEQVSALLWSTFLSLLSLLLTFLVCTVCFRRRKIEHFGVSFSNVGFVGLPLVTSLMGEKGVLYVIPFIALLNVFQWTYGIAVISGSTEGIQPRQLLRNPIIISVVVGMAVFVLQPPLPEAFTGAVSSLASMNAPVAMIILGIYLAQVELKSLFTAKILYVSSAVRLLLIPGLTVLLLLPFPADPMLRLAVLISGSAPLGSLAAIFAQMYDEDYALAVREICLSTILCVVTMPLVVVVFSGLAGIG